MSYASPELVSSYQSWTANALIELRRLAAQWQADHCNAESARVRISEIAHNIKGMGTSFGYPLMTEAGRSLCTYLRSNSGDTQELDVVYAHIDSLEHILSLGPDAQNETTRARFVAPLQALTGSTGQDG